MPPDGLCLFHAVNYASNPEMYHKVDIADNGMLLGKAAEHFTRLPQCSERTLLTHSVLKGISSKLVGCPCLGPQVMPKKKTSQFWHAYFVDF
jgi:hypothetical protein